LKLLPSPAAAITVAAVALLLSSAAHANKALAEKNACLACHAIDKKLVGPAYIEISKKYTGQADALAVLTASIRKGSSGKWGPVPMPAQPALSEADAAALAAWVLGGAK
jgi:cytochrome c